MKCQRAKLFLVAVCFFLSMAFAEAKMVKVVVLGNSSGYDALNYLPEIVAAGGDEIYAVLAHVSGANLKEYWDNYILKQEADPKDEKAWH